MAGTLALICTTAIPCAVVAYPQPGYYWSAYLLCLTVLSASLIMQTLNRVPTNSGQFRLDCIWLGLFAFTPALHILRQTGGSLPPLAFDLVRLVAWNLLGALCYLVRAPERLGIAGDWKPSLYVMHLVVLQNSISYAQCIWKLLV
ncbi:hypothetical protein BJX63DRAFT_416558 [Aspergillus granulosus]|uniref:Uncharacterized protein n=1 Tax=Aspergillus granulosus TaxID=176169 RepID=A0ABR4GRX0_9EURO